MMKINVTKEQVEKILINGGKLALSALAIGVASLIKERATNVQYQFDSITFSDAVNAILASDMLDSRKTEAIELLERGESTDYYQAIISVIHSDMFDSRKIENIKMISEKIS